jgi:hypothetical protein
MATVATPPGPPFVEAAYPAVDVSPGGKTLCLWHIYTGTAALTLGALFGLLQGFSRANFLVMPPLVRLLPDADGARRADGAGVHDVLHHRLDDVRDVQVDPAAGSTAARVGRLLGHARRHVWAALEILSGNATVLYTFYAPLKADPGFYLGATLLIVGTWLVALDIFLNVGWFLKNNPGEKIPLPAYIRRSPSSCGSSRRSAWSPRCCC